MYKISNILYISITKNPQNIFIFLEIFNFRIQVKNVIYTRTSPKSYNVTALKPSFNPENIWVC